jgi:hypothetical protein
MKRRNLFLINLGALLSGGNLLQFSVTGYTFAEFYDSQVMYTLNPISGETTTFVIPVNNNEDQDIKNIYATIEIKDLDGNSLATVDSEPINVNQNERTEIKVKWDNTVLPGNYVAEILIESDDASAAFTKTFKIEQKTITIEGIQVDEFELGEIVNIDILVENHLEEQITNVQANLLIYDEEQNVIDEIQTKQMTLNQSTLNKIETQWNTQNIPQGLFNAKLIVANTEYEAEQDLVFTIGQNSLTVTGIGFAINYAPNRGIDTLFMIIIFVGAIVLINIVIWIVYLKKK